MRYEISNPSDPMEMDVDDREAACVAVSIVGGGAYGLHDRETGETILPIFLFGGADSWWKETWGRTVDSAADYYFNHRGYREILTRALRSIRIPGGGERTSMNDIAGRAHAIADKIDALPFVEATP